ncbi:MAG: PAS domain-containing sensor histidine kinase [Cryomorphaceae bacterium]|nr:PAS domain-containing sensor histidine kinase [Cryomorphaceae bacterium]
MPHTLSPEELYQKYLDLQLRVTRFSSIEQELINTRDQLDHELVMHKRLLEFNAEALKLSSEKDFIHLVAESLIDVCESQIAYVSFINKRNTERFLVLEGVRKKDEPTVIDELEHSMAANSIQKGVEIVHLGEESNGIITSCMYSSIIHINAHMNIVIATAVSKEKAPLYPAIKDRSKILFSLFAQQVESILSNIIIAQQNREQMSTIANAQIELKKLSLIATKAKSGVIISDSMGRIEWVNNSFEQTTGFKLEEVIGKKPKEFLQSDLTSKEDKEKMASALAAKKSVELTVLNKSKSGQHYYNQLVITPVFDEEGNHINFIALQKDITAEENYKKELIQINSRFELITNGANIGMWEWDCVKNITVWNSVLHKFYGIKEEEDLNRNTVWYDSIHPDDKEDMEENMSLLSSGKKHVIEQNYRVIRQRFNNDIRYVKSLSQGIWDEGKKLVRIVGSSIDITEEKEYESRLIDKNTELEKINKELDQFIYSISHDLRSPLLSIKGLLTLIETSVDESESKLYHELIGKSVGRLDNTILEILAYSRNARVDIQRDAFNLKEIVEQLFEDLSFMAAEGEPIIVSDRTRIETLLKNLISNAIKYRKKNATDSLVHVKMKNEGASFMIEVIDNGEGISERNQKKVFDMFYRASSSSQGTGLGLAMCQEIVKKLKGEIKLTSQLGEGTTITLILPNNPLSA